MSRAPVLDAAAVAAIVAHLNDDHADHMLEICRAFGGEAGAEAVTVTVASVDLDGLDLVATSAGERRAVRVTWLGPVRSRGHVRTALGQLHEEATAGR